MAVGWRDISVLVAAGTPAWPGDTPWSCRWTSEIAAGASVNLSATTSSPHVGTHADAPLHVHDGWPASDALPVEAFMGPAIVVDVSAGGVRELTPPMLEATRLPARVERLLLRTGLTIAGGAFPAAWPWLSEAALAMLLGRGLRLLGVDCPSVDHRESRTLHNHHRLFDGGAFVLENLDLLEIPAGPYELFAVPIRVGGLDAAPVRALIRAMP